MTIKMLPPKNESSHIHSLGFDEETGTLAVRFHKGGLYHYHGVTSDTFRAMHSCGSCGSFFHKNIIGKFKHEKR
jgi:hypothetical protein